MADIVSEEQRSYLMSRVKGSNTKPEVLVRSILHRRGFRFTVNGPKNRELPGRPDIVLPARKTVVLVNGCFWHGHEGCRDFRVPKTRTRWWREKIARNQQRDREVWRALLESGWRVIIIWTCAFARKEGKARSEEWLTSALTAESAGRYPVFIEDPQREGCRARKMIEAEPRASRNPPEG